MSSRWPAGVIRKTPVTPAGPLQNGAAPGVWTLAEATYWQKQGLWPIAGNFLAVEDVFSTYLYTGNGSTQTITNGLNVSGQGGLVWIKSRSAATNNFLFDTARGVNVEINSNTTDANATLANSVTAFNSTGFALGSAAGVNTNADTYVSWTFRKAPKFFDVVTYTGNGNGSTDTPAPFGRGIPHSLGVKPGFVVIKRTDSSGEWWVAAQKSGSSEWYGSSNSSTPFTLNSTNASGFPYNGTSQVYATDTAFYPGWIAAGGGTELNINGATYVAYLFAHDAAADGIIQCGSFTTDGSGNATVNLGWEPQWVLRKTVSSGGGRWYLFDTMRGLQATNTAATALFPNETTADDSGWPTYINSTGFTTSGQAANSTDIYIAIRRGPMKTPTVGTSVFSPTTYTGTGTTGNIITLGVTPDLMIGTNRDGGYGNTAFDRLRANGQSMLETNTTGSETTDTTNYPLFDVMNGYRNRAAGAYFNSTGTLYIRWAFKRAPGFFDEVCYTGTGVARTVNHNLGVAPELMIVKNRTSGGSNWSVYSATLGAGNSMTLNTTNGSGSTTLWSSTAPTSSVFSVSSNSQVNGSGANYVAYLFASCPGVSKVGSYVGNGSSQTINCGFTTGARFFLVKASSTTGNWWVYDSARGITAPADPALALNSTAAEVTSADATDPDNSGIIVNQESTCNINVNGATYIFLAIA